jgi:hypothetical protein
LVQKRELLTYHRAKRARDRICPECKEEVRKANQECYWCGQDFSDEYGVGGPPSLKEYMGIEDAQTEEEKAARSEQLLKMYEAQGVVVVPGDGKLVRELRPDDIGNPDSPVTQQIQAYAAQGIAQARKRKRR